MQHLNLRLWEGKRVKLKEDKLNEGCKKVGKKRREKIGM